MRDPVDSGPMMEDVSLRGLGHLVARGGRRMPRHSIFSSQCEGELIKREKPPTVTEVIQQIKEQRVKAADCEIQGITKFMQEINESHSEGHLSEESVKVILRMMQHVESCDRY